MVYIFYIVYIRNISFFSALIYNLVVWLTEKQFDFYVQKEGGDLR